MHLPCSSSAHSCHHLQPTPLLQPVFTLTLMTLLSYLLPSPSLPLPLLLPPSAQAPLPTLEAMGTTLSISVVSFFHSRL